MVLVNFYLRCRVVRFYLQVHNNFSLWQFCVQNREKLRQKCYVLLNFGIKAEARILVLYL